MKWFIPDLFFTWLDWVLIYFLVPQCFGLFPPDSNSCSVSMSDFLWSHGPQHTRLPCSSLSPGVCSNACPLSQWWHPAISSSIILFSCPHVNLDGPTELQLLKEDVLPYQVYIDLLGKVVFWNKNIACTLKVKVTYPQSCLTLCDPMDCSPGSSIHGIFQARILEWVAISFSRRSSQPRDWTPVSRIVGRCFTVLSHQ